MDDGVEKFVILISSVGGNVIHGIHAYCYLKGVPAEIITHNVGSANSIAVALFCAGSKRYCSPHARFLNHGVVSHLNGNFELKQLEENLNILKNDTDTIAEIIASTTNKPIDEIEKIMTERTALDAEKSVTFGLTTEIKEELFESGAEVIDITEAQ